MDGFDLKIPQDFLNQAIVRFGASARQARQVAHRLRELLPKRLVDLKKEYLHLHSSARAERLALTDPRYLEHVEELITLRAQERSARVQYETYLLLLDARRSLRKPPTWQQKSKR